MLYFSYFYRCSRKKLKKILDSQVGNKLEEAQNYVAKGIKNLKKFYFTQRPMVSHLLIQILAEFRGCLNEVLKI